MENEKIKIKNHYSALINQFDLKCLEAGLCVQWSKTTIYAHAYMKIWNMKKYSAVTLYGSA